MTMQRWRKSLAMAFGCGMGSLLLFSAAMFSMPRGTPMSSEIRWLLDAGLWLIEWGIGGCLVIWLAVEAGNLARAFRRAHREGWAEGKARRSMPDGRPS